MTFPKRIPEELIDALTLLSYELPGSIMHIDNRSVRLVAKPCNCLDPECSASDWVLLRETDPGYGVAFIAYNLDGGTTYNETHLMGVQRGLQYITTLKEVLCAA